jgi:nucleoside-diphosphate-sugar epimerase
MSKTILVIGATGIQGSSVASVFPQAPNWTVRGLVRDPSSPKAVELAAKGVELVKGDLTDPPSIAAAAEGVHVIFANTRFNPAQASESAEFKAHAQLGQSPIDFHYEEEVAKGRNIADAAANVRGLERLIWSSASEPGKWSKGKYDDLMSFESKGAVWKYIQDSHQELAKKTSILYLGSYATNWRWGPAAYNWIKKDDGSVALRIPGTGPHPIPFVVPSDTGNYVLALTKVPPGKKLVGCSECLTWDEFVELWSRVVGVKAVYEPCTIEEHAQAVPGGYTRMIGNMYEYATQFGYWGDGDPDVVFPEELGVQIKRTPMEEFIKNEDWSRVLN